MQALLSIIYYLLGKEKDLDEFCLWAFGPYFREYDDPMQFMDMWNHLHGDKLTLVSNGEIKHDLPKMIQAWRDKTL